MAALAGANARRGLGRRMPDRHPDRPTTGMTAWLRTGPPGRDAIQPPVFHGPATVLTLAAAVAVRRVACFPRRDRRRFDGIRAWFRTNTEGRQWSFLPLAARSRGSTGFGLDGPCDRSTVVAAISPSRAIRHRSVCCRPGVRVPLATSEGNGKAADAGSQSRTRSPSVDCWPDRIGIPPRLRISVDGELRMGARAGGTR